MTVHTITHTDSVTGAAKTLNPGDTLQIRGGMHWEQIALTKSGTPQAPITIKPYEDEPVQWRSQDNPLDVAASHVIIQGIHINRRGHRGEVRLRGDGIQLTDCHVQAAKWYCLIRVDGTDCLLARNKIHGVTYGPGRDAHCILTRGTAHRMAVIDNKIWNATGDCIQVEHEDGQATDLIVRGNTMYTKLGWRSENALDVKGGTGLAEANIVHGFRDCPGADEPNSEGEDPDPSATGSSGAGFFIHDKAHDWKLLHNLVYDCTLGFRILNAACHNVTIKGNTVTRIAFHDPNAWITAAIQVHEAQHVSIIENIFDVERSIALQVHPGVLVRDNTYCAEPPP